ncbi:MAG: disulfide bond formation protein B [Rhizobacter sp.]|nr:disulfide bond formation protein B [Bacteriovorax sp.]
MKSKDRFTFIYLAWLVNIVSFAGSMYFSNVMMLPPCMLCWYQRICIFPLSLILAVGFLKKDKNIAAYALPLAGIGWIISLYHNLLYYKIIPKAITACTSGVSCTDKQIEYLGFITIPLMAFTSLTITLILLFNFYQQGKLNHEN